MRRTIRNFLQLESTGGIVLFGAAVLAMAWANSPFSYIHQRFIENFLFWINEGLMAVFFLLVGLELKRGYIDGHLSRFSQAALPAAAAIGGMLLPALIYWGFNRANPYTIHAWATPVATDIAFALGVLSLFGRRLVPGLKMFLLALAIFDDLGAILIIALFYSHTLSLGYICLAALLSLVLFLFNRLRVRSLLPYLFVGACLWLALLKSGIHPTVGGVVLALMIPGKSIRGGDSPLTRLENRLHGWVVYLIMPLFALVNAGFSFVGMTMNNLSDSVVLGIGVGLFLGKQGGVFGFAWLLIQSRWTRLPSHVTWLELYAVSIICGMGFTMSLFLGTLSFQPDNLYLAKMRLGVALGSLVSGLTGAALLAVALSMKNRNEESHP